MPFIFCYVLFGIFSVVRNSRTALFASNISICHYFINWIPASLHADDKKKIKTSLRSRPSRINSLTVG